VLCAPAAELEPTFLVDAALALEPAARLLRRGARLHVHHGTRETPARIIPLESDELRPGAPRLAQLRLEAPLVPAAGDRLVLRQLAPPDTIGGGTVLDPSPRKHGARPEVIDRLWALARGERPAPRARPRAAEDEVAPAANEPSLDVAALRLAQLLRADGSTPRTDGDLARAAGLAQAEAAARLRALERAGRIVRVARNLHFHPEPLEELTDRVLAICERDGGATIAGVRDELGTSRRYAQALLEHLDARKQTVRRGDVHVLRASRRAL